VKRPTIVLDVLLDKTSASSFKAQKPISLAAVHP